MKNRVWVKIFIISVLLGFGIYGCDQFVIWDKLGEVELPNTEQERDAPPDLVISPAFAELSSNSTLTFSAFGGTPPYTFSVPSGAGTIIPETGFYTAPPNSGTDIVRVTDSLEVTSEATITVFSGGVLGISPSSVTVITNGTVTFTAIGGTSPYTFSRVSGSGSIDAATGEYTAPATSGSATVRVTDSSSPPATADASITITAPVSLSISPSSITLLAGNDVDFEAFGGVPSYTFSIVSGGGSINSDTGLFTAPPAADTVTVRVTDLDTPPGTDDATVTVNASSPLAVSPTAITLYTNNNVDFSATGGVPAYTFSIVAGGGSINSATGRYTAPGSAGNATIRVTDSDTPPGTSDAAVTIYEPFSISPASKTLTVDSSFTFSGTGGKTPYSFSIASGGGSINSSTGEYTAPSTSDTVVVRAEDDLGNRSDASVSVIPAQALVIEPASKTLLTNATFTFSAIGGQSPYTFSVLPPVSGSINSATGEYAAPGSAATDTVRVTDNGGTTSDATVTVVSPGTLAIDPSSVTVPVNGTQKFTASGGSPPYTFSVTFGGGSINATSGNYSAPSAPDSVTVQVTDSLANTDNASVTVSGSGCGQTYPESEPNDDKSPPWTNIDDFGIVLVPGCSTTITGTTDGDSESDVYKFNTGSAAFITFIATWSSGDNALDFAVYDGTGNKVTESDGSESDSESHVWAVDAGSADRYLELEVKDSTGVNYTLTISGN